MSSTGIRKEPSPVGTTGGPAAAVAGPVGLAAFASSSSVSTLRSSFFLPNGQRPITAISLVARVDPLRVDAEQLRDLLDHHREHQRLEVGAALGAVLDRPPEQHQPGRAWRRCRGPARPAAPGRSPSRRGAAGRPRRRTPPGRAGPATAGRCRSRCPAPGRRTALAWSAARGSRAAAAARRGRASLARAGRGGRTAGSVRFSTSASLVVRPVPRASTKPRRHGGTVARVSPSRRCSRTACDRPAVTTLTYVYADQTAVLGPLATYAEPHAYDLCDRHAERLSAPRGWEVLRLVSDLSPRGPSDDDLLALAERGPRGRPPGAGRRGAAGRRDGSRETLRRGHLRVLTHDEAPGSLAPRLSSMPDPDTVRAVFKAYDVRGLVPEQIDEPLARATGRAYVQVTGADHGRRRPRHATELARAGRRVRDGATEAGADVVMIGLASTDQLYFASGHLGVPGAMFTASHNPAAVQRHQAVPRQRGAARPGVRARRDPRPRGRAAPVRPGDRRGPRRSTSSTAYAAHLLSLAP